MTNAMQLLKASIVTPDSISNDPRNPEQILKDLMGGSFSQEKLEVLMARPDVTGFQAHKLLKMTVNSYFFEPLLQLYTEKFIMQSKIYNSLCYMVMTLQLWIHFIGSCDEKDYKPKDVAVMLPQVRPLVVSFLDRWPKYRHSAVALFTDIEDSFVGYRNYNENSTFPGDKEAPFKFKYDNHVQKELQLYILPFIGKILVQQKRFYQKPLELKALATRGDFSHPEIAGPLYIKSVEDKFSIEDIKPFVGKHGGYMEVFLLSDDGVKALKHLHSICKKANPNEVLLLFHYNTNYAGFHLKDNEVYKNFSLEEKIDFLKPYLSLLESNSQKERNGLFQMWIDDAEWNNPERHIADLVLFALKQRPLFSHNSAWQFVSLMIVILNRIYRDEVLKAQIHHSMFLGLIPKDEIMYDKEFPKDFISNNGLVIAIMNEVLNCGETNNWSYAKIVRQVNTLFIQHLAGYLPEYNVDDACNAVIAAKACNNEAVMEILFQKPINHNHAINLLNNLSILDKKILNKLVVEKLKSIVLDWFTLIESDIDCLKTAMRLLCYFSWGIPVSDFLPVAINRKGFDKISDLFTNLRSMISFNGNSNSELYYFSDERRELLRTEIEKIMDVRYPTKDEALLFCNCKLFGSYKSWTWFYGKYSLVSLDGLYRISLKKEELLDVFRQTKPREKFLEVWKSTPIRKTFTSLVMSCIFICNYLHEHPEWGTLSLQERLNLFTKENEPHFGKMFVSLGIDFSRVWTEGHWDAQKYLNVIESIGYYDSDKFAVLAVGLV